MFILILLSVSRIHVHIMNMGVQCILSLPFTDRLNITTVFTVLQIN